jgi:oligopeptide transport system ATP-binding protein
MEPLLQVKNLKTYFFTDKGIVKAVDGVVWDIAPGETIGLVGESGCGKSVTALSIMRLISRPGRICSGEIIFEGRDLLKLDDREMQDIRGSQIAMVFQEPMTSLNPVLTVERQLTESLEVHMGMDSAASRNRAIELLELVGIPDAERRIKDYPHQFSGGMRQRVMIAIAISCNPKLLIADEPTTAVDVTIQAQLMEIMGDMTKKFGTALVIITHNLGVVARYAQRVNVMYAGRIVERGTAMDIYSRTRHPYTLGLMGSVPRLDESDKRRLTTIEGMPPHLIDMPNRCAFLPRCPYAVKTCQEEPPSLRQVGNSHEVACRLNIEKGRHK